MLTKAQPQVINGLEFYVSPDGKEAGMSATSLARLCGVASQTLTQRVLGSYYNEAKSTHKALESFTGKGLYCSMETSNASKPITAEACACIIEYYAFDTKESLEAAKKSYRAFAKAGIHTWILAQTGYSITPKEPTSPDMSNLAFMKAASVALTRHIQQQENLQNKPGLARVVNDLSTASHAALPPSKITLRDYVAAKGLSLETSVMQHLAGVVAHAYKTHNGGYPSKIYQVYQRTNGKARQKVYGYSVEDYAMIDSSLEFLGLL